MKNLLAEALRAARADYTEIRLERIWATAIAFRGSRLEGATTAVDVGGMVRALNRGKGWGIASFTGFEPLRAMVARAHELSLAIPLDSPIRLADIPVLRDDHLADLDGDAREVPLEEKRRFLERMVQQMFGIDRRIADARTGYEDRVIERWVATSDGTLLYERRPDVRLSVGVVAREDNVVERAVESWAARGGWRSVQGADHVGRTAARRAIGLLGSARVKPGSLPVVLDPRAAGALLHQTLGHLSEADTLARRPDLDRLMRGGRRVASELLTLGDDGSAGGLPSSLPFDDEGAPTRNTLLVQNGVLVGRLHTRETAGQSGVLPTGNARASSFRAVPAARLTNTYVANGRGTLEDLLAGIKHGVYCCDVLACETSLGRFTLTGGWGHLIRDGQLAEPVKPMMMSGDIVETLGRLEAVGGDFRWGVLASGCRRGESGTLAVGEGSPHLRFSAIDVGGEGA